MAAMDVLRTLLAQHKPGDRVYLTPDTLGVSLDQFDAIARRWVEDEGGDWFRLVGTHKETGSGLDLIDLVRVEVFPPQYLFLGGFVGGQRQTVFDDAQVHHVADIIGNRRYTYHRQNLETEGGVEVVYVWDGLPAGEVADVYRVSSA